MCSELDQDQRELLFQNIVDLVNKAFAKGDEGLFVPVHPGRTSKDEI